jgi:NAD(P)-dependent dehydrogenase (short-subunit alcohol dehydrogenase family)
LGGAAQPLRGSTHSAARCSIGWFDEEVVGMQLEPGKVAVVTGAASGIGLALAERFARRGLKVVLADIEERALANAVASVGALGVETLGVPTDVSDGAAVEALARNHRSGW